MVQLPSISTCVLQASANLSANLRQVFSYFPEQFALLLPESGSIVPSLFCENHLWYNCHWHDLYVFKKKKEKKRERADFLPPEGTGLSGVCSQVKLSIRCCQQEEKSVKKAYIFQSSQSRPLTYIQSKQPMTRLSPCVCSDRPFLRLGFVYCVNASFYLLAIHSRCRAYLISCLIFCFPSSSCSFSCLECCTPPYYFSEPTTPSVM